MEIVFKKHVEGVACGNSAGMKRESRREWVCFWSAGGIGVLREDWERERVWRYCWVIGARNHVCWEIAERLLRDCWGSGNVERMLENCCWDSWGNGSVREVWETVVRLLTELKHLSTAFNIPNSTQATSPQKSSATLTESLKNISQTFRKHFSTSPKRLSNISQQHSSRSCKQSQTTSP